MNGVRNGLVIAGLAAAGLLFAMPGAQPASAGELVSVVAHQNVAGRYADKLPEYARTGLAGGQFVSVMPRGGDGQAQAPMRREFDWIPLLVIGGLLATGVGAYLLYSVRRPA